MAQFGLDLQDRRNEAVTLLNFGLDPTPTLENFVTAIQSVSGVRRPILTIPRPLLLGASYPIAGIARAFGIHQPINPVRIRKMFRSTWVEPQGLREAGYAWNYGMLEAFQDWKRDCPQDFDR